MSIKRLVSGLLFVAISLLFVSSTDPDNVQNVIKVGEVTNEIRMGKFAGNRNLSIGVKNILEEILLDLDYDLSDRADTQVNVPSDATIKVEFDISLLCPFWVVRLTTLPSFTNSPMAIICVTDNLL